MNHTDKMIEELAIQLIQRNDSISVAESVTGGYIQFSFSTNSRAQQFFQGGCTVYNSGQKTRHLAVDPVQAYGCNAVSIPISRKMAQEVAVLFTSSWSVGVTGFANTTQTGKDTIDPYCFFSIWYRGSEIITEKLIVPAQDRATVQVLFANIIIEKLLEAIKIVYYPK